jgi:hypothetical protein
MNPEYFIKTNDAIGSIRQSLANKTSPPKILWKAKNLPEDIQRYIHLLAQELPK